MAYILNIETTTTNCSVSLAKSGKLIDYREDNNLNYSHSEYLHVFIEDLIAGSGIRREDLKAIAVSEGPGSYTGLRIGVSSAKGLCYALDIPLISIPTLQSLALQISIDHGYIIPLLDARRLEVYSAVFLSDFNLVRSVEAEILSSDSFKTYLDKDLVHFVGNAMDKTKDIVKHSNAIFSENILPSAKEMAFLSYEKYSKRDFEDIAYFEPKYLKNFIGNKLQ